MSTAAPTAFPSRVIPRRRAPQADQPRSVGLGERAAGLATRWTARLLIAVAALALGLLAVGPHVLGYRTMTMLTGSMSPAIDPGDVTIVTPLPVDDVAVGMIIAYHIPVDDHHVVSHRVIDVEHGADGSVTVRTKGDANAAADPWQARLRGDTTYQVRAVVPELGSVVSALRTPLVSRALLYGAPTLLVGWFLLSIWRPAGPVEGRRDGEEPAQGSGVSPC